MLIATDSQEKHRVITDIECGVSTKETAQCQFAEGSTAYQPVPFDSISWVPDDTALGEL